MELVASKNFEPLTINELETINGGFALATIVVAGVTYSLSFKLAAQVIAGVYSVSYLVGKGLAHAKNRW